MNITINDHPVDVEENDQIVIERDGDTPYTIIVMRRTKPVICLEVG